MRYKNLLSRYSIIACCSITLCSCATYDKEGVKFEPLTTISANGSDKDTFSKNAQLIYDTAQKGYSLAGSLFVNRVEGRKYPGTVDSQAQEEAKKRGFDLITYASNDEVVTTHDSKMGVEYRTVVKGVQLERQYRRAIVRSGDDYNYLSTEYLAWKYDPAMAYKTLAPAAAALGYDDVLKRLMKKGVSPFASFSDAVALSPPGLAIRRHHPSTLRLLLAKERKPSPRLYELLEIATKAGDLDAVKILLGKGLNVNDGQDRAWMGPDSKHEVSRYTPLMNAAEYGHKDIVIYLLKKGADPQASYLTYTGSDSPVTLARRRQHPEIVEILKAAICRVPADCAAWFETR